MRGVWTLLKKINKINWTKLINDIIIINVPRMAAQGIVHRAQQYGQN